MKLLIIAILLPLISLSKMSVFPALGSTIPTKAYIIEDSYGISIGNDMIEIYLNKMVSEKGLPITRITNKLTGWDYQMTSITQHIFSIRFRDRLSNNLWMGPAGFRTMTTNIVRKANGTTLLLNWIVNEQYGPMNVGVHISVTIYDDSPLTCWNIRIENDEKDLALYEVKLPVIDGLTKLGESERNLVAVHPGMYAEGSWLIHDPGSIFNNTHYDQGMAGGLYPTWMPVQFLTYYDEKGAGGIYLATDDTQGYFKWFELSLNPSNLKLISLVKHYPTIAFGTDYEPSYSVLLGIYEGNSWQAATDIYKSWSLKQWWAEQKLIDKKTPEWFKNLAGTFLGATYSLSGFKIVNFSELASSARALNNSLHLFQANGSLPFLLIITGWEANGALRYYPDVFPPFEGDSALRDFVKQVHAYHMKVGAFLLSSCAEFTPGGPSMQSEGNKYLALDEDGNKYVGVFGASGQEVTGISWATTDVSSAFWKNALINIGTNLVNNYDFDLLYMDTFPTQYVSYNPNAKHAPGGGNYAFTSWRDIIYGIRNATKSSKPDLSILVEGLPEIFIPYVDGAYIGDSQWEISPLHEWGKAGEAIPLFSYIYHDRTIISSSWIPIRSAPFASTGYPEKGAVIIDRMWGVDRYWFSVLSRDFVSGKVPTLGATGLSEEFFQEIMPPEKLHFFEKIAYARYSYAKEFLVYGSQVILLPKLQIPTYDLTEEDHWSFRGLKNSGKITLQSIETGIWRSADGRIAYFFANAWNRPINYSFLINIKELGLNMSSQYLAYTIIDGIYSESLILTSSSTINISLVPQQIAMVVIIENTDNNCKRILSSIAKSTITVAKSQILRALSLNRTIGFTDIWQTLQNAETSYMMHNFTDAITAAMLTIIRAENVSMHGFYTTIPLKVRIYTNSFWSSILFENAVIYRVVKVPEFLIGMGNAYVSSEGPVLTGLNPMPLTFEEKYGYQITYYPSTTSKENPEVFELILILGIKSFEKTLCIQLGKESWSNYETRFEITNAVNGSILLNQTQVRGWSNTITIQMESILPKYWLTVLSIYDYAEGSGWYTINTSASFSVKDDFIILNNGTRRVFVGWEGDYRGRGLMASIIMDSPKTIIAKWKTQYYLRTFSEHGEIVSEGWYDEGSEARLEVVSEIVGFPVKWIFKGWSGDLISESPNASILMNSPKMIIANWEADYTQLMPIIGGIIAVAVIIALRARHKRAK